MNPSPGRVVLFARADIERALSDERLVPPRVAVSGPTTAFRAKMARFSAPEMHATRRADVETAVAAIDVTEAARIAAEEATARLTLSAQLSDRVEVITTLGRPVAVASLATVIEVAAADLPQVISDVDAMCAVIGRGQRSSAASDHAVDRLNARFSAHPLGGVAVVSLLYQSMDATATLIATHLITRSLVTSRPVPVARTTRVAVADVDVNGTVVPAGSTVELDIGAAGLWFGAGRHHCPGRALAEAMAAAVADAITGFGATVAHDSTELDGDQRPVAVWLNLPR